MSEPFVPLLPGAVVVRAADPDDVVGEPLEEGLFDEERALVERAVERRRREFVAGRVCARRALAELGVASVALVNGDDRAPVWPDGIVGSIAHTRGYCVVAVARSSEVGALGIDVEPATAVKPELWERICTEAERRFIAERAEPAGELVRIVFSAKEAFYKCQYPSTRQFLGFHDVRLDLDVAAGRFTVELLREAGRFPAGERFDGRFDTTGGYVRTAMSWPPVG